MHTIYNANSSHSVWPTGMSSPIKPTKNEDPVKGYLPTRRTIPGNVRRHGNLPRPKASAAPPARRPAVQPPNPAPRGLDIRASALSAAGADPSAPPSLPMAGEGIPGDIPDSILYTSPTAGIRKVELNESPCTPKGALIGES